MKNLEENKNQEKFEQKLKEELRDEFYSFFETGYDFEFFLKEFLKDLGFTDIQVTQRAKDYGIDLICYKDTFGGIDRIENEKFVVQAKRYKNTNKVTPDEIGSFCGRNPNVRKLFITTSDYTKQAKEEATEKMSDLILLNGLDIIEFYVQNRSDKIFDWTPRISFEKLHDIVDKNKDTATKNIDNPVKIENIEDKIIKIITRNDVRTRTMGIPNEIFKKIKDERYYNVVIDGIEKKLTMNKEGRFFSGVTEFYRKHNYISDEITARNSYWSIDETNQKIYIELE